MTGTAVSATISYTTPAHSIFIDPPRALPFVYDWATAQPGDDLLLVAQIDTKGDPGSVRVSIAKNGVEVASQTATGFPNRATAQVKY